MEERMEKLFKDVEFLLKNAPTEDDCTEKQSAMYSDMETLKESLADHLNEEKLRLDKSSLFQRKFAKASNDQVDELDFFMEFLENGYTLNDIQTYLPEKYEYSKKFLKEHGLI